MVIMHGWGSCDPGSNPGSPTGIIEKHLDLGVFLLYFLSYSGIEPFTPVVEILKPLGFKVRGSGVKHVFM